MSEPKASPFDVLGVSSNASDKDLRRAYRAAALQYHPDKNPTPHGAEQFRRISEAYDTLTNPVLRRRFDEEQMAAAYQQQMQQQMQQQQQQMPQHYQTPQYQQQQASFPFPSMFANHQRAHEQAMHMFQAMHNQQHEQLHRQNMQHQMQQQQQQQQNPFHVSCPPGTRSTSASQATRVFGDTDGSTVRVTEQTTLCDGVRTVVTETVRQTRDGHVTRDVKETKDEPIDFVSRR